MLYEGCCSQGKEMLKFGIQAGKGVLIQGKRGEADLRESAPRVCDWRGGCLAGDGC